MVWNHFNTLNLCQLAVRYQRIAEVCVVKLFCIDHVNAVELFARCIDVDTVRAVGHSRNEEHLFRNDASAPTYRHLFLSAVVVVELQLLWFYADDARTAGQLLIN